MEQSSSKFRHLDSLNFEQRSGNCFLTYLKLISFPFIIYVLIICAYVDLIPLKVENHSLVLIGIILFIYLFFARHNGEFGYCRFCKNYDDFIKNFKDYVERNFIKIGDSERSNASFENFAIDYSKKMRNQNYSSIAAGIFPTLGILGTFISIAVTMPEFSTANSKELEKDISMLLTGVGTAFYVSIYGIFLSIWWIFFEKKGISKFEKDLNIIKNVTTGLFWTREEIEQTHLKENIKNFEKLNKVFENISSNDFTTNLNNSINERLKIFDEIIQIESDSVKKTSAYIKNAMDDLLVIQKNKNDVTSIYENLTLEISKFNKEFKDLKNELFLSHNKIYTKQEENIENLDRSYRQLHELKDDLNIYTKNYLTQIENSSSSIENSLDRLSGTLKDFNENQLSSIYSNIAQNLNSAGNDIKQLNNSFEQRINHFDDRYMEKLKNTLEVIDTETAQIVEKLASLKEQ